MKKKSYTIHTPSEQEEELIDDELMIYNLRSVPPTQEEPFVKFCRCAKDADGNVIGGVLACAVLWHVLHIESVWVADAWRGQGLAAKLLHEVEEEAREYGCYRATVDTYDFQAKPFYEKCGYTECGRVEDMPKGHTYYYLTKSLEIN